MNHKAHEGREDKSNGFAALIELLSFLIRG